MILLYNVQEVKFRSEQYCNPISVSPTHWQSAAPLRPVRGETGNQHKTAGFYRLAERLRVSCPVLRLHEEMQNCPVVPEVRCEVGLPCSYVGKVPSGMWWTFERVA